MIPGNNELRSWLGNDGVKFWEHRVQMSEPLHATSGHCIEDRDMGGICLCRLDLVGSHRREGRIGPHRNSVSASEILIIPSTPE